MASQASPEGGAPSRQEQPDKVIKSLHSRPLDPNDQTKSTTPPSLGEAIESIKKEDFATMAQAPCTKDSLVRGMTSGGIVGGLRWAFTGTPKQAGNWAVGFFLLGSLASYEYCRYSRTAERTALKRQVEIVGQQEKQKHTALEEAREAHSRLAQEEEAKRRSERPWYKVW